MDIEGSAWEQLYEDINSKTCKMVCVNIMFPELMNKD